MTIQEFIIKTHKEETYLQRPVIFCNDGFFMSVQGGSFHYCSPKGVQPYYASMEIGFPSKKEPLIMQWCSEKKKPTETVYGWVPVEIIQQVIEKHGGINESKTFSY